MYYFKNVVADHSNDSFSEAMGLTREKCRRAHERIFYTAFDAELRVLDMVRMDIQPPTTIGTQSGKLQACLALIDDPAEYEYTLYVYSKIYRLAKETFVKWLTIEEARKNGGPIGEIIGSIISMVDKVEQRKIDEDLEKAPSKNAEEDRFYELGPKHVLKRIELTKECKDFEDFYNRLMNQWFAADVISQALRSKGDE